MTLELSMGPGAGRGRAVVTQAWGSFARRPRRVRTGMPVCAVAFVGHTHPAGI